jgi:hypothetical protein
VLEDVYGFQAMIQSKALIELKKKKRKKKKEQGLDKG